MLDVEEQDEEKMKKIDRRGDGRKQTKRQREVEEAVLSKEKMKKIDRRSDGKKTKTCSIFHQKGRNKIYHSNHALQTSYTTNEDITDPRAWEAARTNVEQTTRGFAYSQPTTAAGIEQGVARHFLSQPTDSARQTGFGGSTSVVPKPRRFINKKGSIPK